VNEGDIRDVKEAIFILVLVVNAAHKGCRRGQDFVDKDKDRLFGSKLDALADDIAELADRQVRRHKVFLLVYRRDIGFLHLLANHLERQSEQRKGGGEGWAHTGILSVYFCLMRSASALRFSNVCSSLNLDRMLSRVLGEGMQGSPEINQSRTHIYLFTAFTEF
jgi:hypothetical protein